ncbi:hypothetical protein [Rhodococcus erythropolis]
MTNPNKPTTNLTREELEMQFIELFSGVSAYGYSWSKKVTIEEYIKMLHDGAIDHQEAAHKAMQLIDTYTQAKEREARIESEESTLRYALQIVKDTGINFVVEHLEHRISECENGNSLTATKDKESL